MEQLKMNLNQEPYWPSSEDNNDLLPEPKSIVYTALATISTLVGALAFIGLIAITLNIVTT